MRNRSFIFSWLQHQIIQYITPAKLQKASAYQLTGMIALLYDKERLEMGLSTQNIAYADMVQAKRNKLNDLKELDAKYNQGSK